MIWIAVYWWWEPVSDPRVVFAPPMAASERMTIAATDDADPDETWDTVIVDQAAEDSEPGSGLAVEPPRFMEYTVRRGDTLASIARAQLGSARHADAIARANPMTDPSRLREGRVIKIPLDPANVQGRPIAPAPERPADAHREYVVRSGDSLSEIAYRMYGSTRYVDLIFEANRERLRLRSADSIRAGQTLIIPPKPAGQS